MPANRPPARQPAARHVLPEFTERTSAGHRTMDPYSKLLEERIVFLGTPIDDTSANDVMAQFMYLEYQAPDRDISLYINSPGGSFSAMTAIYDTMRYVTCDVETICLGQAGSAAAVLLAAGTPGKRFALPGARVLIHQPALAEPDRRGRRAIWRSRPRSCRATGGPAGGDARPAHRAEPRSGSAPTSSGTRSSTPQAAVEYGLVDRVVPSRKTSRTLARREVSARMLPPELPPLPALTRAEGELIDRYLDVVDLLGRINPARPGRHLPRAAGRAGAGQPRRPRCATR